MIRWNGWQDSVKKGLLILCFLFLIGMMVRSAALIGGAMARGDRFGAFFHFGVCMLCGLAIGMLFVVFCLRGVAENMIDTLMAPRRYLDRPAPLVTPVRALIKQERYEEAFTRLEALRGEYPEVPELRILAFDLLSGPLDRPEEAIRIAEEYFTRPERIRSEENLKLVLRCAGLARDLGRRDEAIMLLTSELRRLGTGYCRAERKLLGNQLAALRVERNG